MDKIVKGAESGKLELAYVLELVNAYPSLGFGAVGDGLGEGHGMLGQAGSGKLRISVGQNKLAAKVAKKFKERSFGHLIRILWLACNLSMGILSDCAVTDDHDHSEKELKAVQEKTEVISSTFEAGEEENDLITVNEVENEKKIENAQLDRSKMGARRSKRTVKDPYWMKDFVIDIKAKGKGNGKKHV
ncbi:hypothetical protein POM88_037158 [Heracleum sosnowskyi]|uniref:Uncharacterized protein n=1 Tax=Heracleum sosnowskyi TaxID=360622 RepID=A0AAD8HQM4_9APIA|nr:hypothetical protein POM88_037158 [Heracleum sosnowskyi]